ncbi:hypothetical protein GV729_16110 [Pseudomonas sp. Fl4BN2]|nr:hypothetical protein [Pseudomonas sp. Fl4BN2]
MSRENFPPKARKLIEASAGHQCSYPACNRRTTGPGPESEYISNSGYAAHIYSASKNGPRGQGGLSPQELKSPKNGIWLCGRHAKIVDNNEGVSYPSEVLLSYKALHEARVQMEHEGLYPPIGWLHELTIVESPLFSSSQTVQLAKLNLIYGNNCTGKTAITEWIEGFFNPLPLARWMRGDRPRLNIRLTILNPKLQKLGFAVDGSSVRYSIDGSRVAFIPLGFRIIRPKQFDYSIGDDREMLAESLSLPISTLESLLEEVDSFSFATVTNLRFEKECDDGGVEVDSYQLLSDVKGTASGLTLRQLSRRESERVLMELSTATARLSGRYCPTLLILDDTINFTSEDVFEFYSPHLLDPLNQFQTLMCIPERDLDLDNIRWNGWQVIRTSGKPPNVSLRQDIRTTP